MKTYIATFYSHFDALMFYRSVSAKQIFAKTMPVPRALSSSCGTSVQFYYDDEVPTARGTFDDNHCVKLFGIELEGLYELTDDLDI